MKELGTVYWVTGLAGAGKTTISRIMHAAIKNSQPNTILLDGDKLRVILGKTGQYSQEERKALAMQYARLCHELAQQGMNVVCATISMFDEVRAWNRSNIEKYEEIYLEVPPEVLIKRDQKNLYSQALAGQQVNVVGLNESPELPKQPDVVIHNDGTRSPEEIATSILSRVSFGYHH